MRTHKTFSKNLRKVRKKLKLSQEKLAEILGTTKTSIFRYEKDGISPSLDVLIILYRKLNVNLNWLLNDDKDSDDMFINKEALALKTNLKDILSAISNDKEVIELIESLEVPIMRSSLVAKYLECKWNFKEMIADYYKNKQTESQ